MKINLDKDKLARLWKSIQVFLDEKWVILLSFLLSVASITYFLSADQIVAYGDAESHLNIAKRVVDALTPGAAQLGGIWLPLPHLLMVPLVKIEFLWRSGLAGSIVSGIAFVVAAVFIYRFILLLIDSRAAAFVGALVFMTNPNILYMQATPMTELLLIAFSVLSAYYFLKFFIDGENLHHLIVAAFFGFCATLSRYDGWFLVIFQAGLLVLWYLPWKSIPTKWKQFKALWQKSWWPKMEGMLVLFATLAFVGIAMWLFWDFLILGDPLYFTSSEFSAKSQQQGWLAQGQLPAFQNIGLSFLYYFVTAMSNVGVLVFFVALVGAIIYWVRNKGFLAFAVLLLIGFPFVFYVVTLYMGQSVIFIPHITPTTFDWTLFNARYGLMMVPFAAVFFGYLFYRSKLGTKALLMALLVLQLALYGVGYSKVVSYEDGVRGLSAAKQPDAELFLADEYDHGLVLIDDFARTISIIKSGIPMENVIYVGTKPYWEESFDAPEKHARWIVMQKNDAVWKELNDNEAKLGRVYAHFQRVYTSPEIQIFRRAPALSVEEN